MNQQRRDLIRAALAAAAAGALPTAHAQAYPARPIRYIVPVAPGGGSDLVGRTVTERWAKVLGQTIFVENLAGAGGVIASQAAMKANPDGYTLMQGYVATHGTNPATRRVPYDPVRDFTPIGMIGMTPNVLVVSTAIPATTLAEFIAHMRANPGRLSYGSAGPGSLTHLTMELFKQQTGTFAVHVPYRGIAPAFTDLVGGQTQAMFPGLSAALPFIRSQRARPLAVTGSARHPLLPDVPTLGEAGFRNFDSMQWYGVVGPANMPAPIVQQLNESLATVLRAPDLADKLSAEALAPQPMSPEDFGRYIRDDVTKWSRLAKERGIELDG